MDSNSSLMELQGDDRFPQTILLFSLELDTVEPPNKGHFGGKAFVLFSEVVLWWEVRANVQCIAPSRPNIPR